MGCQAPCNRLPVQSPGMTHFTEKETGSDKADALAKSLTLWVHCAPGGGVIPGSQGPETTLHAAPTSRAVANSPSLGSPHPSKLPFLLAHRISWGQPPDQGPASSLTTAGSFLKGCQKKFWAPA